MPRRSFPFSPGAPTTSRIFGVLPPMGIQEELLAASRPVFPPAVRGVAWWVGMRLDAEVDWDEVAELCLKAYPLIAPSRLRRLLDET